jgi:DNA-binding response OmpR family regulator
MQILIVHDDAEVGEQLMRMVTDYTAHPCDLVESDTAALRWAREHARCRLLLAQLEGPAVDGLTLGGSLGEIFPGLQTLFFPAYPAAEQRIEISDAKVFPEPIDGERLLHAIESAAEAGSSAPDLFHVLDVLQMFCLGGRSGAVQIVKQTGSGIVYLRDGKIVHAEGAITRGTEALREIAAWGLVEFAYDPTIGAPETISLPWDEALAHAVVLENEEKPAADVTPPLKEKADAGNTFPQKKRGFFSALRRS